MNIAMLLEMAAEGDPERIVLGSDYPFPLGEARPGTLIESLPRLPKAVKRRLLADNALEFLGLVAHRKPRGKVAPGAASGGSRRK